MLIESRWYRLKDIADILGVTPQRASQMAKDNMFPHYKFGHTVKIDRVEFHEWLESRHFGHCPN